MIEIRFVINYVLLYFVIFNSKSASDPFLLKVMILSTASELVFVQNMRKSDSVTKNLSTRAKLY